MLQIKVKTQLCNIFVISERIVCTCNRIIDSKYINNFECKNNWNKSIFGCGIRQLLTRSKESYSDI